ncbi:hypothetical protein [Rhizobium tibeticum]|uniref:hypothetical protein n=1 Tax=Rhizobium tibeticum TaxID=501024 RepID=UPI001428AEA8|nr:hypothetical protein [Rhizobium tibeticum]
MDDAGGDLFPLPQGPGGRSLGDFHWVATPQEIARQEGFSGDNLADFVKADGGGADRLQIGLAARGFLEAPALEIDIDKGFAVRLEDRILRDR